MRLFDVAIVSLAVAGAAYVFDVKHQAENLMDSRSQLARGVDALSQDVALLEADLAALENPQRLQGMVAQIEGPRQLSSVRSGHYIALDDIPFRQEQEQEQEQVAQPLVSAEPQVTGSIASGTEVAPFGSTDDSLIGNLLSALANSDSPSRPNSAAIELGATPNPPTDAPLTIDELLERLP